MIYVTGGQARPEGALCDRCNLRDCPFVPRIGPDKADLVVVGEAPGDTEVRRGEPFVGRAGMLLNQVLQEAGIEREKCYITNACCCRPLPHRAPRKDEIECCRNRLFKEIASRRPKVILALGNAALKALTYRNGISNWLGATIYVDELSAVVVPSYHPAAVLRSPRLYAVLLRDVKKAVTLLQEGHRIETAVRDVDYTVAATLEQINEIVSSLTPGEEVAIDVETGSDGSLLCVGLCWNPGKPVIIPAETLRNEKVREALNEFFGRVKLVGHNLKFDIQVLWRHGYHAARTGADTMLEHYTMNEIPGTHGLKQLAREFLNVPEYDEAVKPYMRIGLEKCPREVLYEYNAKDTNYTLQLHRLFLSMLDFDNLRVLNNLLYPASDVLARMEYVGIMVDIPLLNQLREQLTKEMEVIVQELHKAAGKKFNPDSFKQVIQVLYTDLELPIPGRLSADKDALKQIAEYHPIVNFLLQYRATKKQLTTYVEALLEAADENHRVHTTFNLHGTVCVTGDTIVLTNRGWYRIRDLFTPRPIEGFSAAPPGLLVYDGSSWQPVTHLFYGGRRPTLCVKLALGVTLRCTKEHPLFTERGWVAAGELRPGDYVLTAMGVTPDRCDTVALQPELARLIGYFVADGTLDLPATNGSYRLRISNRNPAVKADVAYCIAQVMGKEPYIGPASVEISDKEKVLWFARLVDYQPPKEKGMRAYHKTCPTIIRKGNRRTILEYLRGLTNDASFSVTNKKPYCVFRTVNRDVAEWTHQLLLALGYRASFVEVPDRLAKCGRVYVVRLRGNEALRFLRDVRPIRLDTRELEHSPTLRDWCRKHTKVDAQGRVWLKVLDVQEGSVEDVFDLTVCITHAFTTNCVVSHNTGRLSSSNPLNLQNIPKKDKSNVRDVFIATPGYTLIEGDLSQAEVRGLAYYSRDPNLIDAIVSGVDMHTRTACLMFKTTPENVTPEMRQAAKRLTFGVIYQMTAESLAHELNVSITEAEDLIERFFAAYPKAREWIHDIQQEVLRTGRVKTPFGRVRRFGFISEENKAEVMRQAVNAPIQSLASDVTLTALIKAGRILKNSSDTRLLLTVHDSILLETKHDDPREVALWLKDIMSEPVLDGIVPFVADVKIGSRWGSLEEIK